MPGDCVPDVPCKFDANLRMNGTCYECEYKGAVNIFAALLHIKKYFFIRLHFFSFGGKMDSRKTKKQKK